MFEFISKSAATAVIRASQCRTLYLFEFISKSAATAVIRASQCRTLYFYQKAHPFSSYLKSVQDSAYQHSFSVAYLINSCGFSPEVALAASKYVKFEAPHKPDLVLAFFKNHDFTIAQISNIVKKDPRVILCDPQKILLPKLEFLKSKGVSTTDVARILSTSPFMLRKSLENTIIPCFNFLNNFLESKQKTLDVINRFVGLLLFDLRTTKHNIKILQEAGVQDGNIRILLLTGPRVFMVRGDRFRKIVKEVEEMGFNPSRSVFVTAVHAMRSMTKPTWDKKVEVYKKWGWTEDDILVAFKKHPWCMKVSEGKIDGVMDYFVNNMGWEPSPIARNPVIISMSLEKRIVPRSVVYHALLSKRLIKTSDIGLISLLHYSETRFLKKVLSCAKDEGPELLKLYKEKLDLAQ